MSRKTINLLLLLCANLPMSVSAQKTVDVHAEYSYEVGENDNITLREARRMLSILMLRQMERLPVRSSGRIQ